MLKDSGDFDVLAVLKELEGEMAEASAALEFERAALLRDQIIELKKSAGMEVGDRKQHRPAGKKRKVSYSKRKR